GDGEVGLVADAGVAEDEPVEDPAEERLEVAPVLGDEEVDAGEREAGAVETVGGVGGGHADGAVTVDAEADLVALDDGLAGADPADDVDAEAVGAGGAGGGAGAAREDGVHGVAGAGDAEIEGGALVDGEGDGGAGGV